ncbi:uncharacterized protein LOC144884660 [Branchiostoma floridae x Branchiostoma japonicum]
MDVTKGQQVFWALLILLVTAEETFASRVTIRTHGDLWAGTNSDIDLTLRIISLSGSRDIYCNFPCERSDWCLIRSEDTVYCDDFNGILKSVTVRSHGGEPHPSWRVDWVKVSDDGREYTLEFDVWMDPGDYSTRYVQNMGCYQPQGPTNGRIEGGTTHNSLGHVRCNSGDPGFYPAPSSETTYLCYGGYRYPTNPSATCRRCLSIANCHRYNQCTRSSDSTCMTCVYDRGGTIKAYQLSTDNTTCTKLCSWRPDSKFCYPGRCTHNTPSSCTCAPGFSGNNCLTIGIAPVMHTCVGRLKRMVNGSEKGTTEAQCADNIETSSTTWVTLRLDNDSWIEFEAEWETSFQGPNSTDWPRQYYIDDHGIGVISASVDWWLGRDGTNVMDGTVPCLDSGINKDNPKTSMHDCKKNVNMTVKPQHGDRLYFRVKSRNGGYVKIRNYDGTSNYIVNPPVYFSGCEIAHTAHFTFDLNPPYHCSVLGGCTDNMLDRGKAITKDAHINLHWSGWRDDDSGISEYEYEVFMLASTGEYLQERQPAIAGGKIGPNVTEMSIVLNETGVYSIVLTVEDSCGPDNGNFISARRFLIFDNNSTVEVDTSGHTMSVDSGASSSTWLTDLQDSTGHGQKVVVKWPGHFYNHLHHHNKFLNPIKDHHPPISSEYEERTGIPPETRSREEIPNVNGIVLFQTDWAVDHEGGRSLTGPPGNWTNVTDMVEQQALDIPRRDGDTIRVWIRAYDVMGNVAEDNVTVHVDSSPPTVEGVSLSRLENTGLAVHNSEDLFDMKVVFTAYDDHSGLHDIHWQLHDMADPRVVHGEGQVAVRKVNELECSPPTCTCIPKDRECYIRNYQFELDEDKMNNSVGTHDFDYYFVITVTNNAMLQTQATFQVTVDTSPPLPGHVHDSLPGETDTDYQQDVIIHASWEGFFDRESGVMSYLVAITQECLTLENMTSIDNDSFRTNTTSTYVTWDAPHPGTYYCTVVAFNRALEPSEPVCSDGVTVDTTPPVLREVVVDNAHYKPGLLQDGEENVWMVDRNGYRYPAPACGNRSREVDGIELWPLLQPSNSSVDPKDIDDSDCHVYEPLSTKAYLSQDNKITVHWYGEDQESDIYDYEVGLSSTESPDVPDILPFTTTNSRPHFTTYHPNLGEGKQFYLVIRAINRAQMVTTKVLGPYIVDVTPPTFSGQIKVSLEQQDKQQMLVGRWEEDAFFETDGDDALITYEFAVGHSPGSSEVHQFTPLPATDNDVCNVTFPPVCVSFPVSSLDWQLHGTHTYYLSVRVENTAGLSLVVSSGPYVHVIDLPSSGVVMEVSHAQREPSVFGHKEDIDFQNTTEELHCEWRGFSHPHLTVTYQVGVGTTPGADDVITFADAGIETHFSWTHLQLQRFQMYYVTVMALTEAGNTSVTSDGVRVVLDDDVINGTNVYDGQECKAPGYNTTFSHHAEFPYGDCAEDINYQASTTAVGAHWSIADDIRPFVRHIEWSLQREDVINGATVWEQVTDFRNVQLSPEATWTSLSLTSGDKYRSVLRLCHTAGCFKPIYSDGFRVLHEPPIPGQITDISYNSTAGGLTFTWERFTHGHVTPGSDSYMLGYEWTLASEMSSEVTKHGDVILPWQAIGHSTQIGSKEVIPKVIVAQ